LKSHNRESVHLCKGLQHQQELRRNAVTDHTVSASIGKEHEHIVAALHGGFRTPHSNQNVNAAHVSYLTSENGPLSGVSV
jgi:hypothetical protein